MTGIYLQMLIILIGIIIMMKSCLVYYYTIACSYNIIIIYDLIACDGGYS